MAKTVRVTDQIAFQNNMLALHAAVEAAHADAASVEFGQVADEVRGLSQPSAQRSTDAETLVEEAESGSREQARTKKGAYTADELNAQSADLTNIAVRLAALAGDVAGSVAGDGAGDGEAARSAQPSAVPVLRAPAKASGF